MSEARSHARAPEPKSRPRTESLSIRAVGLRELMRRADPPNLAGTGPEFGVLICIVFAMPIYAIFAWKGLHPLLANNALPNYLNVVLATAGVEALKLMSIAWLPLLAALGLRQYYYDEGTWVAQAHADESSAYTEQRLAAVGLAFAVSFLCLSGVATLWAFFIARDVSNFKQLLVGGNPFLLFYPTMALVTVPLVWLTLAAADARARGRPGGRLRRGERPPRVRLPDRASRVLVQRARLHGAIRGLSHRPVRRRMLPLVWRPGLLRAPDPGVSGRRGLRQPARRIAGAPAAPASSAAAAVGGRGSGGRPRVRDGEQRGRPEPGAACE